MNDKLRKVESENESLRKELLTMKADIKKIKESC